MSATRIGPVKARELVEQGDAVLVCAYDDEEKCEDIRLEGAMTFGEFKSEKSDLSPGQTVIFYCT